MVVAVRIFLRRSSCVSFEEMLWSLKLRKGESSEELLREGGLLCFSESIVSKGIG